MTDFGALAERAVTTSNEKGCPVAVQQDPPWVTRVR